MLYISCSKNHLKNVGLNAYLKNIYIFLDHDSGGQEGT